ncbi:hypothetical protein C8A03DRAFT_47602 [Achaetomium macrosporum]|uniref:Uncharacterized protein n=1 Tax=Achaetomium macrosporum TaxID=79813 RepID=A0AAN7H433_9PEZI|nr:hypothetical protein C8A03DRAFT_47602 [Achaetomium macrosporum]
MSARATRLTSKALRAAKSAAAQIPTSAVLATAPIRLFEDAAAWETWLEVNHTDTKGLWLKISKKNSAILCISYEEVLDTALCCGWIDGQKKSHDVGHFLQRSTPRRLTAEGIQFMRDLATSRVPQRRSALWCPAAGIQEKEMTFFGQLQSPSKHTSIWRTTT